MEAFTDKHSGYQFVMASGNECAEHIKDHGIFEWSLIKWCEQFCDKDKTFVDIGAHMGTYSIHLSKFSQMVHSFEAQSNTYACLMAGIGINKRTNIIANNIALSDHGGKFKLYKVSPDGGGSTLDLSIADRMNSKHVSEIVAVRTLDSFELENIGFLKLDVEGSELKVLRGAVNTLERSEWPKFIFEAWPDDWYAEARAELIEFVEGLGYAVTSIRCYNNMYLAHRK